ncbi:MAG TPA: hypothetical protein VJH20_03585, partial [Candidatus Nanoarchaeia archaeon]|nr:hypothetical protein [Candidatus Nanoarchaeia archaeon]
MPIKIEIKNNKIILPLYYSQGGIRIADEYGNHVSSPTKTKNEERYYIEWMITNDEIRLLSNTFLEDISDLLKKMQKINKFAEDTKYSKRTTSKTKKEIGTFEGFK